MSRARLVAVGTLVLLLAAAPFIPRGGGGDDGSLLPAGDRPYAARVAPTGPGVVDSRMRTTIDRALARDSASEAPCAVFEEQQYCVGVGWTDQTRSQLDQSIAFSRQQSREATENTGDLSASSLAAQRAAAPRQTLLANDRAELEAAAASVAKVVLLRHDILGMPLPAGFLDRHPEARTSATSVELAKTKTSTGSASSSPTKSPTGSSTKSASTSPSPTDTATAVPRQKRKHIRDYPKRDTVLDHKQVAEQTRTYWCGPTTMQMITWGWSQNKRSQQHWATRLHTTTSGTAITDMVRVVNHYTGWDKEKYAGPYITLDIKDWGFKKWLLLMMRHVTDYHAPVVLHPILLKKFYPYLDDDASGHFQVGRGYNRKGDDPVRLGYFEPWNQQRFDPSEPYIARVQWRNAYRSYRANEAHFQHNVGV